MRNEGQHTRAFAHSQRAARAYAQLSMQMQTVTDVVEQILGTSDINARRDAVRPMAWVARELIRSGRDAMQRRGRVSRTSQRAMLAAAANLSVGAAAAATLDQQAQAFELAATITGEQWNRNGSLAGDEGRSALASVTARAAAARLRESMGQREIAARLATQAQSDLDSLLQIEATAGRRTETLLSFRRALQTVIDRTGRPER